MRAYNFNGGPGAIFEGVLEQASTEMLGWNNTGMSVMENSHRSKEIIAMFEEAGENLKKLLNITDDDWKVLFLQGGATMQFAMVPLNFAGKNGKCDYINTGLWATKAYKEAQICGASPRLAASSEADNFTYIPKSFDFDPEASYVHLTSNNTVRGTAWKEFPQNAPAPLVSDMSSDFLSRPIDVTPFGLIYAGAQKNIGPAGLTIVLIRKSFAEKALPGLPTMLDYNVQIKNDSMYNTPPVFASYIASLTFKWLLNNVGGLEKMQAINEKKASLLYNAIDSSSGFYTGTAKADSRSLMNVTFRLPSEDLENKFKKDAAAQKLVGLGGHRSVGGLRASIYNAVSQDAVKALVDFMADFQRKNG